MSQRNKIKQFRWANCGNDPLNVRVAEVARWRSRQSKSPEEKAQRAAHRARTRARSQSYLVFSCTPEETACFVQEENEVIQYLRSTNDWTPYWKMLNYLSKLNGRTFCPPEAIVSETMRQEQRRHVFMALVTRMRREQKLVIHRRTRTVKLAEWLLRPLSQQIG